MANKADDQARPASTLYLNGRPIWHNPAGIGHAFVKLRKDVHEEEIIKRMYIRHCLQRIISGKRGGQ